MTPPTRVREDRAISAALPEKQHFCFCVKAEAGMAPDLAVRKRPFLRPAVSRIHGKGKPLTRRVGVEAD
jgi:hypothetical protein